MNLTRFFLSSAFLVFFLAFSFSLSANEPIRDALSYHCSYETDSGAQRVENKTEDIIFDIKKIEVSQKIEDRLMSLAGFFFTIFAAFVFSINRKKIKWKLVAICSLMQLAFAFLIIKSNVGKFFFNTANNIIVKILSFSKEGAKFLFGNLTDFNSPVGIPRTEPHHLSGLSLDGSWVNIGAFFAFSVLPAIIFFSALTAILHHLRVLEWFVRIMAKAMQRLIGTSGAESFSAAANIFLGQTEAPLLIKPFLGKMTLSELHAVMSGGFATASGGVLAAYVSVLSSCFSDIAGHLMAASVLAAPASLVMSKIMFPETEIPETAGSTNIELKKEGLNVLDAAAKGTSDGLALALNVGAMLIAFISLISLLNWSLGAIVLLIGVDGLSLEIVFSWVFAPVAFLLGVPWQDASVVGSLFGTKTVVNELVAYMRLADEIRAGSINNPKSVIIATYALCGFANFSSIGIQIGGLSVLAPNRRTDLAKLGFRAMVAGTLACFQTAAMVGFLI